MSVADILPPELVYEILLYAAKSSTSSCHALCQVSTWARRLALPHLYATISITPRTLPMFFVFGVRHIWIAFKSANRTEELIKSFILQYCRNLSHFAIDARDTDHLFDGIPKENSNITSVEGVHILMLHNRTRSAHHPYDNPFFARVTHLRFGDPLGPRIRLLRLGHMRRLTHFAVPCSAVSVEELECIPTVVQDTAVKCFVLIVSNAYLDEDQCRVIEDWVCGMRKVDKRIYLVRSLYDGYEKEWDMEVRGGVTIWERAFEYTRLRCDS
ncbi:hypothetical protein BD779DRAFT_1561233 [Infundibulicybe gibba]|nr:hypothetical protein BD779DRAFT_1561233 [Infundibulicybe gibba]